MLPLLVLLLGPPTPSVPSSDAWDEAPHIVAAANRWHEGQPLPKPLLRFQETGGCFGSPTDTVQLLSEVTNVSLLVALASDHRVDNDTHEEALQRGLYLTGPNTPFAALRKRLTSQPSRDPWSTELRERLLRRHVVVDGLFISYADMPAQDATTVLNRIERDLRSGESWQRTYEIYSNEFGYRKGTTTKIGNLGDFVVFPDPALTLDHHMVTEPGYITYVGERLPRRLARLPGLQTEHIPAILAAAKGDVLKLQSTDAKAHVLYQVREVYDGDRAPNNGVQRTRFARR